MNSRTPVEADTARRGFAPAKQPLALVIFFIVAGLAGLYGSFQLTIERFALIENPDVKLSCDINPFIACGTVIQSWQGSLFGFPNPLIGLMCFVAPIAVGVGVLAGGQYRRWFWVAFNLGVLGSYIFIHWLMSQTIFVIGTLCPYCMLVWLFVIPLFWYTTVNNLARNFGLTGTAQSFFQKLLPWTWIIVLVNYAIIIMLILNQFPLLLTILFA